MKMKKNICFLFILCLLASYGHSSAEESTISVYCTKEKGKLNRKIFGNNSLGYDPKTYEKNWQFSDYYGFSNYGEGIWDPQLKSSIKNVIISAKNIGISVLRFPGGSGSNHYEWKSSINPVRKYFLYGLNEFLNTCKQIGAEPVYTLSYFTGNENDAAELIRYVNNNDARQLCSIKYFELGNEVWGAEDPNIYADRFIRYYTAMKEVDNSIQLGAILQPDNWKNWNTIIAKKLLGKVDFIVLHVYPGPEILTVNDNANTIFLEVLGPSILKVEKSIDSKLTLFKQTTGRSIPLAITEFNGEFMQDKPIPYRHCLGTALLNAELLRIFMKPTNNILMACYWQFCNSYWGMIANGFDGTYKTLYNTYYKRPNYYVFEMYARHFGEVLIDTNVKCDSYAIANKNSSYLSVNASKSKNGNKIYLMVINKNMDDSMTSTIDLKDFTPANVGNAWILNGPSVDATNEVKHDNVKVTHRKFGVWSKESGVKNSFEFTFEPHSLTAIEIEKAN